MGDGKIGRAPCGHPGEAVVGQYYRCLSGCDDFKDEETTPSFVLDIEVETCPYCHSDNVADFSNVWRPSFNPTMHCWDCGQMWTK